MSSKPNVIYNRQNTSIHRALKDLGMPYNAHKTEICTLYGEILGHEVTGLSGLTLGERDLVLRHYQKKGLKLYRPFVVRQLTKWRKDNPEAILKGSTRPLAVPEEKKRLISKIEALIGDMNLSWKYADGISNRMFNVRFVEWCSAKQLHKIVVALVVRQRKYA